MKCDSCGHEKDRIGKRTELRCRRCRNARMRASYAARVANPVEAQRKKEQRRTWFEAHRDEQRERNREWRVSNLPRYLLNQIRGRARRAGIPCDLTLEDIVIPEVCPVLGIPLVRGKGHSHAGSPSFDRFDPKLGYVKGNVRVISYRANTIKSDATVDELRRVLAYMTS